MTPLALFSWHPKKSLYIGYVSGTGRALWFVNFVFQRLLRIDSSFRYLKHFTSRVLHPEKILIEEECAYVRRSLLVSGGCYINAGDGLFIGRGTIWAPNVSIISQDHEIDDFDRVPMTQGVRIGRCCWLGAGSVILPGVELGDHTIVGANAVVTKSFPGGGVVLAGVPARPIRSVAAATATSVNSFDSSNSK